MNSGTGIEKYLKALAHRVRRDIIRALAEKGKLSYSELMRITGVEDSGTFAFHIKMLQGLIEKDPMDGEYKLTEKGLKAYKALKILSDEHAVAEVGEAGKSLEPKEILYISDRMDFVLTRKLAEKLRREGKKIFISDVVNVEIEDMPEDLLEDVLEGVSDVLFLDVPKHLRDIVELRSNSVFSIGRGGFIGGLVSSIVKNVMTGVTKSLSKGRFMGFKGGTKPIYAETDADKVDFLDINIDTSRIDVEEKNTGKIVFNGRGGEDSIATIDYSGGRAFVNLDTVNGILSIPREVGAVKANIDTSSLKGSLSFKEKMTAQIDTSSIDLALNPIGRTDIDLDADTSNITLKINYGEFKGISRLVVRAETSSVKIDVHIPRDTAVKASIEEGYGKIRVNGFEGRSYIDQGYGEAGSKLEVIVFGEDSRVIVNINRATSQQELYSE